MESFLAPLNEVSDAEFGEFINGVLRSTCAAFVADWRVDAGIDQNDSRA